MYNNTAPMVQPLFACRIHTNSSFLTNSNLQENTGFEGGGGRGNTEGVTKNGFGAIPYFLVIANDQEALFISKRTSVLPKVHQQKGAGQTTTLLCSSITLLCS